MDLQQTTEKRNSGLNSMTWVIWLMELGALEVTLMKFYIPWIETTDVVPLLRLSISIIGLMILLYLTSLFKACNILGRSNFRQNVASSINSTLYYWTSNSILKYYLSDHCSLVLDTHSQKDGPYPFIFENMWLRHNSFEASLNLVGFQTPLGPGQVCGSNRNLRF